MTMEKMRLSCAPTILSRARQHYAERRRLELMNSVGRTRLAARLLTCTCAYYVLNVSCIVHIFLMQQSRSYVSYRSVRACCSALTEHARHDSAAAAAIVVLVLFVYRGLRIPGGLTACSRAQEIQSVA